MTADTDARDPRRAMARLLGRWGPFVAVLVLVAAAVALFRDGGGDDDLGAGEVLTDREELVRSGPMTPERAELEGRDDVEFGASCDAETGRIKLPTVYAPPCVAPFDGDNGGAISEGVTEEAVRVTAYVPHPDALTAGVVEGAGVDLDRRRRIETIRGYVDLYNQLSETYGRRVEVEFFEGTGAGDDGAAAKADAIAIAETKPFAVIGGPAQASPTFADELAARGVICLEGCAVGLPDSFMAERSPYVWMGSPEPWMHLTAEAVIKLAGPGNAAMAGDPELRQQDRVYAVVHYDTPDGLQAESFGSLRDALADGGIELATDVELTLEVGRMQETARTTIAQLEAAGVTTVIYAGDPLTPQTLTAEATAQDYFPEWILGSNYLADTEQFARTYDPDQWRNGFGVVVASPATEGLGVSDQLYQWAYGTTPPSDIAGTLEPPLRTLFTGIHLAGPSLTPETFRDGLHRYPPSGGSPVHPTIDWSGRVGGDATLVWWDPEAEGLDEGGTRGPGMYRFANGGQRYRPSEIPDTPERAGLFDEGSSVVTYDELPPEDRSPDYPPPG
jgi:hypothetical protein